MTRYYVDELNPSEGYYEVKEKDGKFRWVWREIAEDGEPYVDQGEWVDSMAEALRYAAYDFGVVGNGDEGFVSRLQALAARAERESIHAMGEAS